MKAEIEAMNKNWYENGRVPNSGTIPITVHSTVTADALSPIRTKKLEIKVKIKIFVSTTFRGHAVA
jgi:hypothetical protein